MKLALSAFVAAGLAIGFLIPAGDGDTPAEPTSAPQSVPDQPRETRLTPGRSGHFHTEAMVNGKPVEFIVDTGATVVALTIADARRIGIPVNPAAFQVIGSGASGPVQGQPIMIDRITLDGKEARMVRGAVIQGLGVSLLGQAYLSRISSVTMSRGEMILR